MRVKLPWQRNITACPNTMKDSSGDIFGGTGWKIVSLTRIIKFMKQLKATDDKEIKCQ